jgi:hypothetical protein
VISISCPVCREGRRSLATIRLVTARLLAAKTRSRIAEAYPEKSMLSPFDNSRVRPKSGTDIEFIEPAGTISMRSAICMMLLVLVGCDPRYVHGWEPGRPRFLFAVSNRNALLIDYEKRPDKFVDDLIGSGASCARKKNDSDEIKTICAYAYCEEITRILTWTIVENSILLWHELYQLNPREQQTVTKCEKLKDRQREYIQRDGAILIDKA